VYLVGFSTKKFVTMHGHMNVKKYICTDKHTYVHTHTIHKHTHTQLYKYPKSLSFIHTN